MEQRRVKVRMKAAEGKKAACQKLNFYVKLLEKDTAGMPGKCESADRTAAKRLYEVARSKRMSLARNRKA